MAEQPTPTEAPALWLEHLRDETDAAFLYTELSRRAPDPECAALYQQLARVEERHVQTWQSLLRAEGHPVPHVRPSLKARLIAWLARMLGSGWLIPLLLEEEGREVKSYLELHRAAPQGVTASTALQLAKESKEHAETLAAMTGSEGEPWHKTQAGGFLRNVVYGFNDGLTANFGLVAGMIGAQGGLHVSHTVVLAGVAGTVANALSMGSSGYLAAKSEREVFEHEIAMEREEIRVMPDLEREELSLLYQAKGIPAAQAATLAGQVMRDPERALAEKVREELQIGASSATPLKEAWLTGAATALGSLIPVLPLLVSTAAGAVWASFTVAMVSHFGVGAARSVFTGRGVIRSGIDMFAVGLGVAAVGYLVGDWLVTLL